MSTKVGDRVRICYNGYADEGHRPYSYGPSLGRCIYHVCFIGKGYILARRTGSNWKVKITSWVRVP